MKHLVACIQMTSTADVQENLRMAQPLIEQAAAKGAKLIELPEMFALLGMDQMDKIKQKEEFGRGPIQDFLSEQAAKHNVWIIGGTIPISSTEHDQKVRAACLVYNDTGECVTRYDKIHLFDVVVSKGNEVYAESSTVEPGHEIIVVPTPFGRLGVAVCYDVRFPELFRQMHAEQVEIIALPSAFTYTTGVAHWDVLVRARAVENQSYVIAACQSGEHPNKRKTYGHSMIVNPWGEVIASLPDKPGVIVGEIDLNYLHQVRQDFPSLLHRRF